MQTRTVIKNKTKKVDQAHSRFFASTHQVIEGAKVGFSGGGDITRAAINLYLRPAHPLHPSLSPCPIKPLAIPAAASTQFTNSVSHILSPGSRRATLHARHRAGTARRGAPSRSRRCLSIRGGGSIDPLNLPVCATYGRNCYTRHGAVGALRGIRTVSMHCFAEREEVRET